MLVDFNIKEQAALEKILTGIVHHLKPVRLFSQIELGMGQEPGVVVEKGYGWYRMRPRTAVAEFLDLPCEAAPPVGGISCSMPVSHSASSAGNQ
ncbi:hypothetical protein [Desulfolithobacter sp.]